MPIINIFGLSRQNSDEMGISCQNRELQVFSPKLTEMLKRKKKVHYPELKIPGEDN